MDERLTIPEAAKRLGLTTEAIRQRIRRQQLTAVKEDGRLYVVLDVDATVSQPDSTSPNGSTVLDDRLLESMTAHIASLSEQVTYLQGQLSQRNTELERRDILLQQALVKIPQLEAPKEPEAKRPRWQFWR